MRAHAQRDTQMHSGARSHTPTDTHLSHCSYDGCDTIKCGHVAVTTAALPLKMPPVTSSGSLLHLDVMVRLKISLVITSPLNLMPSATPYHSHIDMLNIV